MICAAGARCQCAGGGDANPCPKDYRTRDTSNLSVALQKSFRFNDLAVSQYGLSGARRYTPPVISLSGIQE
jgi:hypothetical protein